MDEIHGKKWDKNTALKGLNNEFSKQAIEMNQKYFL
jgi:hypothetical protein